VLAFALLVSFVTGLVFGAAPALQSSRIDVTTALKEGAPTHTAGSRFLSLLVVSEVALAFILLVGAGLLIKSFVRLTSVDPGFEPERVLTLSVSLPEAGYETSTEIRAFSTQVLERLRNAPGVRYAGAVNWLPLSGNFLMGDFAVADVPRLPPGLIVMKPAVGAEYFQAMGIPVIRGRSFTERDTDQAPGVAIVTDQLARQLWPGQDALGKRITLGFGRPEDEPWLTVVGVVGDVKQTALGDQTRPAIYAPLLQAPRPFLIRDLTFVARAAGDASAVASVMRREIRTVDPALPFARVKTMQELLASSVSEPRFRSVVLGGFASAALALVAVGILGVLAYGVTRRTREIGVRMALGAQRVDVLRLIVRHAVGMTLIGVTAGLIGSIALTRLLTSYLFDVRPIDPATFVAASFILVGVSLAASYVPARRATRVDPLIALRSE
jgi:putative ABC transport system permease protein